MSAPVLDGPLVSVAWLTEHLSASGLVLLDARITREPQPDGANTYVSDPAPFIQGHIPGARFAALTTALSDPSSDFNFTLPAPAALAAAFGELGVSRDSTVVIYDDDRGQWAARVWLLLRSIGHDMAGVLNGGLGAWTGFGHGLETGAPAPTAPGDLSADPRIGTFIDHAAVKAAVAAVRTGNLVCALDRAVYTGERSSGAARAGHIPGSANLPFSALVDPTGLIDPARVDAEMLAAGLDPDQPVIAYCGGGINAAGLALALVAAGHPDVAVYDGSLAQWAADADTEMALGAR